MPRFAVLLFVSVSSLLATDKPVSPPAAAPAVPPAPTGFHRVTLGKHTFTLPVGFNIELVAESPQVDRPVTAAFDDKGRLYVADSSGSNAKPADQLKDPTHRVVMLESTKKDGKFDMSTVFADKLSFLQGTMWHAGSLYVSTPPTIQKLTDTDGDGTADKREVWFDGKVLTGCANDVHGPYHGPEGRIYWTKGAFAKQELTLGDGKKFVTRAAHIYSAKPDGTDIRVEMTGGMDNPVDVAFNSVDEMFFTTTFFQHPANGRRDGIIHATYGAVYGKDHDPLNDHIRTRPELSEPMTHLGPAAPAGLHCYRSGAFGDEYRDNLFACQFNLAKVSRHILKEKGSTYETIDSDFVVSDNRDFHPTDVIEDADGSLLIVDTGGWYKLCCPSSVMEKKDLLGGIYRVRKAGAKPGYPSELQIVRALDDRPRLWRFARQMGQRRDAQFVPIILKSLGASEEDVVVDTALTRAIIDIGDAKATAEGLQDKSPRVKRAALAALDQMSGGNLKADDVIPHLGTADADLRNTAWWIAGRHEDWGDKLVGYFDEQMKQGRYTDDLIKRLARFAGNPKVQQLMAEHLAKPNSRPFMLTAIRTSGLKGLPECWEEPLAAIIAGPKTPNRSERLAASIGRSSALHVMRTIPVSGAKYQSIIDRAKQTVQEGGRSWTAFDEQLVLACSPVGTMTPDDETFVAMAGNLRSDSPQAARDALARAKLTAAQLEQLAAALPEVSPVYLSDLLTAFTRSTDEKVGFALVSALRTQKLRAVVRLDQVKPIFDKYPKAVQEVAAKLYADLEEATKEQRKKLDTILSEAKPGDVRRGQAVFNSTKAACSSCHKVAYVGGLIGPDLTKIGSIRSERDLLEAVVFPSASFVRSYEPMKVTTYDGRAFNGILKKDAPDEIVLTVNATDEVRLNRKDVDEVIPGTVSVMPAGLDQQLSAQELADLVAFLKSLR